MTLHHIRHVLGSTHWRKNLKTIEQKADQQLQLNHSLSSIDSLANIHAQIMGYDASNCSLTLAVSSASQKLALALNEDKIKASLALQGLPIHQIYYQIKPSGR